MPVKTLPYSSIHKQKVSTLPVAITVLPVQASWQQWLSDAIEQLEQSLLLGTVVTQYTAGNDSPVQLLNQGKALLTNALEHTDTPWLVQEVLALVLYYLGQPAKAKELAFKSLNSYEDAVAKFNLLQQPTTVPAGLKGFAALTLALLLFKQGLYPLALEWFKQVTWQQMPLLLRFDGLEKMRYAQRITQQLHSLTQPKTALLNNPRVGFWQHWLTQFSIKEQWQLCGYGIQSIRLGFSLAKPSTTAEAFAHRRETGNFTIPSACLAVIKEEHVTWQQRLRSIKRCLKKTAQHTGLWLALGRLYLKAGHCFQAKLAFEQCITLCPTESLAQLELGHLYQAYSQPLAAAKAYTWAFITATNPQIKRQSAFALGLLLEQASTSNTEPSSDTLLTATITTLSVLLALLLKQEQELPFSTSGTPSHMAKICQQLAWNDLAYWCCLQSLTSADIDNLLQCSINLAFVAADNQQPQEAVYYYRKAIALNQQDISLYNSLGTLYLEELLLIEPAKTLFEFALNIDNQCATSHYYLGKIYGLQRQWTLAAQSFSKAKALNQHSQELDETELENCLHQLYENM
jgi:tetratricopeptide (TPR) repeat protein